MPADEKIVQLIPCTNCQVHCSDGRLKALELEADLHQRWVALWFSLFYFTALLGLNAYTFILKDKPFPAGEMAWLVGLVPWAGNGITKLIKMKSGDK